MSRTILHHLLEKACSNKHRRFQRLVARDPLPIVLAGHFELTRLASKRDNRQAAHHEFQLGQHSKSNF